MLDQYRAVEADTEADAQNAATTADSYENLMAAVEQYESESYTEDVIADTMVLINRDTLGASGQAKYDELAAAIFPAACQTKYETGVAALNAANYEGASRKPVKSCADGCQL